MVERFHIEWPAWPDPAGELVPHSDYQALERQLAEALAAREADRRVEAALERDLMDARAQRMGAEAERDRLAADNARLREALERLLNPAPGVKKLPPWVYGIAKPALAGRE